MLPNSPDADALTADDHDDPLCTCDACERECDRVESRALSREAHVHGGLCTLAHELLGVGWLFGGTSHRGVHVMIATVEQLAQRALGDLFEQLGQVGEAGRVACKGAYTSTAPERASRAQLANYLNMAGELVDYARGQLAYLTESQFRVSDTVAVQTVEGERLGTYLGLSRAGWARVMLEGQSSAVEVCEDKLREVRT